MNSLEQYMNYAVEDWLEDADFIQWVKDPNKGSLDFNLIIKNDSEASQKLQEAKMIIQSVCSTSVELSDSDKALMWQNIRKHTIQTPKTRHYSLWKFAAAAITILLITGALLLVFQKNNTLQQYAQLLPVENTREIQFVMPNEKTITLENLSEVQIRDNGQIELKLPKGERVVIQTEHKADDVCQLVVPGGKRASVILSDGTHINVHPGSKVVFPMQLRQKQRKVYLEGEAFLNVTKNPNSPFAVQTRRMQVNVLGTSFNVMAYPKQAIQSVVLVTGHVKVKTEDNKEQNIEPNQHYQFDSNTKKNKIETVNTEDYTSWKDGILNFSSQPLSQILDKVSNYYNVSFAYNSSVSRIRLSGKLDLNNTLEAALKVLTTVAPIEIKNQKSQYIINVKP